MQHDWYHMAVLLLGSVVSLQICIAHCGFWLLRRCCVTVLHPAQASWERVSALLSRWTLDSGCVYTMAATCVQKCVSSQL